LRDIPPQLRPFVTAVHHEFQELGVPDRRTVDHDIADVGLELRELVVPAERNDVEIGPEHHRSPTDRDGPRRHRAVEAVGRHRLRSPFVIEGELLEDVLQGLLVHQLVLDGDLEDPAALGKRITVRAIGDRFDRVPQLPADPIAVLDDLFDRRPLGRRFVGIDSHRVDPALEE
jgi:hypothetical protein